MPQLRCVLWDLDGTIVDSEAFDFKSAVFRIASGRLGLSFDLDHAEFRGREARSIFHTVVAKNGRTVDQLTATSYTEWYEFAVEAILANAHLVRLRPGVAEGFQALHDRGVTQGVVTSSRGDVASSYLARHGLGKYVGLMVARGDVIHPKPHPEAYALALQRSRVAREDCVAIEDSNAGIASAVAAGVPVIAWLEAGYQVQDDVHPDYLVRSESFRSIWDLLRAVYFRD